MNYIENVYICLAAPLLMALVGTGRRTRRMILFLLGGMTACLLSSYISTFLAYVNGIDRLNASLNISPIVEEIMKLLPVLFYLLVFEPEKDTVPGCMVITAVGFATFENVCYMTQNGTADILHLLIRGFGTGAMHVICGLIVSLGILYLWDKLWLRLVGTLGLLSVATTYHAVYNLLVSQQGVPAYIGYFIPFATALCYMYFYMRKRKKTVIR